MVTKGDARPADVLDVPVDGAPGHLEAPGQLRRSNFALLQQDRDDPHQAVDFHSRCFMVYRKGPEATMDQLPMLLPTMVFRNPAQHGLQFQSD